MKSDHALSVLLPDEVMMEILSWLPVKLLIQFTCVCKSWKSLISDPIFVKLHLRKSPNNVNFIVILNRRTFQDPLLRPPRCPPQRVMFCSKASFFHNPFIAIPLIATRHAPCFDDHIIEDHIIGSCNGLICCLNGSHPDFRVRFWNPEMRLKSEYSPILPLDSKFVYPIFGFGYDKSSDTYKVVAVLSFHNWDTITWRRGPENLRSTERSKPTRVKVYTMGEHCWRDIQTFPAFPVIYHTFQNEGTFFRGTLNWLVSRNLSYCCDEDLLIVSLDLGTETYKQFSLPSGYGDEIGDDYGDEIGDGYGDEIGIGYGDGIVDSPPYIAILGDCLHLFLDFRKTHLVVSHMREFGVEKSWTQVFKLSYQDIQIRIGEPVHFFSLVPLCTAEHGIVLTFVNRKSGIFLYNWRDDIVTFRNYDNNLRIDVAKDHVQSLIMPY